MKPLLISDYTDIFLSSREIPQVIFLLRSSPHLFFNLFIDAQGVSFKNTDTRKKLPSMINTPSSLLRLVDMINIHKFTGS
jgi:hypothetical protein